MSSALPSKSGNHSPVQAEYERTGFLVLRNFFDVDEAARWRRECDRLEADPVLLWAQFSPRRRSLATWKELARSVSSEMVQGTHYGMLEPPNVTVLHQRICSYLGEVQSRDVA